MKSLNAPVLTAVFLTPMKEELIQQLEDLLKEEVSDETFSRADEIKNQYLRACEEINSESLKIFLDAGGLVENFDTPKDSRDGRFSELLHILSDRETKFRKIRKDEVVLKQKEKEQILVSLEKLIAEETNIGRAFHAFKELQSKWNEIGNVPTREYKTSRVYITDTLILLLQHELSKD